MSGELGTTNLLLGIMAAVSLLEAFAILGMGIAGFKMYSRVITLVDGVESRHVIPAMARVNAILDDGFLLANGALRSMAVERTAGYGRSVLQNAYLSAGDILIIVNAYGVNSSTIDCATYAREIGVTTIGVTSVELQRALPKGHPARHPSNQDLTDVVDITIDTKVPVGDALMEVDGIPERVGAVSTFANSFALNALILEAIAELARRGIQPPIWRIANSPGGDEANQAAIAQYRPRIKRL